MRRVVVTGMGIFSCLGNGVAEVEASLRSGRSGIGIDERRTALGYRSALTGILPAIDTRALLDRRSRLRFSEHGAYAYIAVKGALAMAGIDSDYLQANEVGLLMGNDSSAGAVIEGADILRAKQSTALVGSNVFQALNSTLSMNLAVSFGLTGVSFTISAACASSSHAVGMGTLLIRSGMQERVICGGAQEVGPYSVSSFDGLEVFSCRTSDPTAASRPFDKHRDGLVPSGGGAALVLESLESAQERGATILAEVAGYGFTTGAQHLTTPSIGAPRRAMQRALDDAGIGPQQIGYVNAHATSTPVGDANEAQAIADVFGECQTPVTSTKSMTGHELWMAGASEAIYSIIMMNGGFVAPNLNLTEPDEAAQRLNIPNTAIEHRFDAFLSNSFGFGGTNSALVFRKFK